MDKIKLENYILKMKSGIELPESKKNDLTNKWEKTGNKIQAYEYIFVKDDISMNKVVITSPKNFALNEGGKANLIFSVGYNSFERKNKFQFDSIVEI